jgi:hypothetical protein
MINHITPLITVKNQDGINASFDGLIRVYGA